VIDFFMAGAGLPLFDLAVAVNDWCTDKSGQPDPLRREAMLEGYTAVRPWEPREADAWADLLCLAAMRFWVSRLAEQLQPRALADGALVSGKDPDEFRAILLAHRR
jgi:homoserine kinase type II